MNKKNVEVITYITFAVLAIANTVLCLTMGKDPDNQALILPFLFVWIGYLTSYFILLYLDKKEAFFIGLIPIIIQIIQLNLNISEDFNKVTYMTIVVEIIAYICRSVEYFKIFTNKNYVSARDRRWEEKEKYSKSETKIVESTSPKNNIEESYNLTKELYIKDSNTTLTMTYKINPTKSKGMLLKVGKIEPSIHDLNNVEYYGNDDYSNDTLIVCENHVIVEENWDDQYYFDINDLEYMSVVDRFNGDGLLSFKIGIKLKDGTTYEFGGFDPYTDELEQFKFYVETKYSVPKIYTKKAFERPMTEVGEKFKIIPYTSKEDSNFDKEEHIENIDYREIVKIFYEDINIIELLLTNDRLIELYKMDNGSREKLVEKINNKEN